MTEETWKAIDGYDGMYEVSTLGRVRSYYGIRGINKRTVPKVLSQGNLRGYRMVNLTRPDGAGNCSALVHQLVAMAFIGEPPDVVRPTVNHKNRERADNRVENLEWCSHADNNRHSAPFLSRPSLSDVPRRADGTLLPRLKQEEIERIRAIAAKGLMSHAELGKAFGVTRNYVWTLCARKRRSRGST